jgi:hypothetical protein
MLNPLVSMAYLYNVEMDHKISLIPVGTFEGIA